MEKKDKYFESTGRRKTSTARVRIFNSSKFSFIVNDVDYKKYFKTDEERRVAFDSIKLITGSEKNAKYSIEVKVKGGGLHSQAEAVRHGLARAFVKMEAENRDELKGAGYLKRDARAKERRKFGLKKARKAAQWSKR
jgi:small subunit ribosomal protein S9